MSCSSFTTSGSHTPQDPDLITPYPLLSDSERKVKLRGNPPELLVASPPGFCLLALT